MRPADLGPNLTPTFPTFVCLYCVTEPVPQVSGFVKLSLPILSWGGECYAFGTSMSGRVCSKSGRVCL